MVVGWYLKFRGGWRHWMSVDQGSPGFDFQLSAGLYTELSRIWLKGQDIKGEDRWAKLCQTLSGPRKEMVLSIKAAFRSLNSKVSNCYHNPCLRVILCIKASRKWMVHSPAVWPSELVIFGLERWLSNCEYLLLFQRTRIQIPASTTGVSQLESVTPGPGHLMPLSSEGNYTHMHIPTCRHTHLHITKNNKINLKKKNWLSWS